MKVTALIIAGSSLALAAPRAKSQQGTVPVAGVTTNNPAGVQANAQGIPNLNARQKAAIQAAIQQWSLDTSLVSCSLNMLPSGQLNAADFSDAADAAYDAEVDETIQKATLDALLGDMPLIQSANANLTNGTFISVVDGLRELRVRGPTASTQAVVDLMNTNRCRPIMEAIDAYLLAGALAIGNNTPPTAVRPQACLAVVGQTASILTPYMVNNCTTFPRANELVRDYGQSPTFQISNGVALSQNRAISLQGALGDTFPNQGTQSSALGTQPGLSPNGFTINGPVQNAIANPVNVDLGLAVAGSNGVTISGVPVGAAGIPVGAGGIPATAAGIPVGAAGVPVAAAGVPVGAAGVPVAAASVPVNAASVPVAAAGAPVAAAGVPVAAAAAAPVAAAGVPAAAAPAAAASVSVPAAAAAAPAAAASK